MKRWAGLLTLFLLAALGAVVISTRYRPQELEKRHATIRVGMTADEVEKIMGAETLTYTYSAGQEPGFTWLYVPSRRFMARAVQLEVDFDGSERVTRTIAAGKQLQP